MKRGVGYVLAILGLIALAVGLKVKIPGIVLSSTFPFNYLSIAGGVLIVVGVLFVKFGSLDSRKSSVVKQASEEVPIYEGVGKTRKIVGYRKG